MDNASVLLKEHNMIVNRETANRNHVKLSSYILIIFIVLLPISTALAGIIGSISLLNYISLAYIIWSIIEIIFGRYMRISKTYWAIYAYMGYTLLSCIWNIYFSFNYYFTTFATSFVLFVFLTCRTYSQKEAELLRKSFLASCIVVVGVTALNVNHTYAGRIVIRITSTMDPNDFGCGTCIIFASLLNEFSKKRGMLSAIGLICILVTVILTGSRGALLMCIMELIVWVSIYGKRGKRKIAILGVLAFLAVYLFVTSLSNELLSRFSVSRVLSSGGTGRRGIWIAGINKYLNSNVFHMIFGYGHGSFPRAVNYYGGSRTYPYEAHNMFVNALIEGGVLGLSFLVIAIKQCVKTAYANKNYMGVIALLGFVVTGLTLDVQSYRIFPIAFFTAVFFENNSYYPTTTTEMKHESL